MIDDADQLAGKQQGLVQVDLITAARSRGCVRKEQRRRRRWRREPDREAVACHGGRRDQEALSSGRAGVTRRRMRCVFSWAGISEHAASRMDHSAPSVGLVAGMFLAGHVFGWTAAARSDHAVALAGAFPTETGSARICTRFAGLRLSPARCLASIFADGTPVFANDFSQSCDDGPRMLPSM